MATVLRSFGAGLAQQRVDRDATVAPLIYLPAMFVFRRHVVEQERMLEFYGDVLGFERLPNLGDGWPGQSRRDGIQAGAAVVSVAPAPRGR